MLYRSPIFSQASGSLGGITFARNRGGAYTRQRVKPVNPNTSRQAVVKANFASLQIVWSNLSPTQRLAWQDYANAVPVTNKIGDPIVTTGQNMFFRANTLRLLAGLALIDTASTQMNLGVAVSSYVGAVAAATLTSTAAFAAVADSPGDTMLFVGRPIGAAVNFYAGPYQLADVFGFSDDDPDSGAATLTANLRSDYPVTAAERLPVRLVNVTDDGRVSSPFSAIVGIG